MSPVRSRFSNTQQAPSSDGISPQLLQARESCEMFYTLFRIPLLRARLAENMLEAPWRKYAATMQAMNDSRAPRSALFDEQVAALGERKENGNFDAAHVFLSE
jgi:hypothetical protein